MYKDLKEVRIYSCYWSPNSTFQDFENFLYRLGCSVRGSNQPVIVGGDFNAKSGEWGSPIENAKGKALADLAASLGLAVCNQGHKPTFVRGASESYLDVTFVSQTACGDKGLDDSQRRIFEFT